MNNSPTLTFPITVFHATRVENWLDAVREANVWVHVGTRQAAIDRASIVTRVGFKVVKPAFLHSVRIDRSAFNPFPEVSEDLDEGWEANMDTSGFNALAYQNEHEDHGSLSLLVSPKILEVVSTRILLPSARRQFEFAR